MAQPSLGYVTVDVFTRERYAGNPLAIVHIPRSVTLTQSQKQTIAREFNFSETVFLHDLQGGLADRRWTIDIFMTEAELPFAGHPTIGTACYVLSQCSNSGTASGTLVTKAGPIEIQYDGSTKVAKASIPHNVRLHNKSVPSSEMKKIQHLDQEVAATPVFSVVKGMTFLYVDVNETTLKGIRPGQGEIKADLDEGWTPSFVGSYYYCAQGELDDGTVALRTRMIEGNLEDPATGSAASGLAAYLTMKDGEAGQTRKYAITQGVEMGRKSDIGVEVTLADNGSKAIKSIVLSGSSVMVMEGKLVGDDSDTGI